MLVDGWSAAYAPEQVCGAIKLHWGLIVKPDVYSALETADATIAAALAAKRG